MYRIAIVDDDREFVEELKKYINQYGQEEGQEFEVSAFYDGAEILESYVPKYDLILLDIEMPKINGMDVAEKIREVKVSPYISLKMMSECLQFWRWIRRR